ncbi:MAG: hypothetical protein B6D71_13650 [gamma proteobacterium symbiont of Stewartia floridana]|nr:MAG: hypothetical protein B6D71_13650 [gamma proteobacterium symbiont of Stewartia floridana]
MRVSPYDKMEVWDAGGNGRIHFSAAEIGEMDLEGWELQALHGARRHILEERPNLAIAVYHQAADFRTIFEYITGLCPDYRVYLRHYTEGWSETIMYFIPADSNQPSTANR